ncbi:uncharacterized protein LOC128286680 [Gossypium arboreum]|uniref:uncharacterized protein LOC128286680 n=1 Tax=Gossypium arboreum TaxID=29729 RepID=UPI0022F19527|nr:uncharacterized protein LOC128286680 [Gossypium arboreum]XP_052880012.1 uncharacterized protein LOC128286680 [Gossypium arboreum]XP_052880013.1 uncharacterized protein LOC128286680 [Gossypium arboreum]
MTEAEKNIIKVDDEADSAIVGKFDQFYEDYGYYETSDDEDEPYHSRGFKSLNTTECYELHEAGKLLSRAELEDVLVCVSCQWDLIQLAIVGKKKFSILIHL